MCACLPTGPPCQRCRAADDRDYRIEWEPGPAEQAEQARDQAARQQPEDVTQR